MDFSRYRYSRYLCRAFHDLSFGKTLSTGMRSDNNPFKVTVIGNGAAIPSAGKYHSAQVVNASGKLFLMDCGEGTQKAMLENGINPQRLKAIFISHLHGDHFYGLFPLLETLALSQRPEPLKVFAPLPLNDVLNCISEILYGGKGFLVDYHPVDTTSHQMIYENQEIEVWSLPLKHRVPSSGYLVREKMPELNIRKEAIAEYNLSVAEMLSIKKGADILRDGFIIPNNLLTYLPYIPRSYAYCTDTVYSEQLIEWVQGVDLLYHEASFADKDRELAKINGHSTTTEAAEIALKAGVKKLLIGHFSLRYKDPSLLIREAKSVFPDTEEAVMGRTYDI